MSMASLPHIDDVSPSPPSLTSLFLITRVSHDFAFAKHRMMISEAISLEATMAGVQVFIFIFGNQRPIFL